MNFNDIAGQKEIIESLKTQLENNKIGHAYIFSGPQGIGKRFVAKIFSAALLCNEPDKDGCCGKCQACRLFMNNSNPDYYVIEPDGTSIGVDDIRKMQQHIVIRPLYSDRKVYVITEAEKMTVQAQNCLLKTFEEPPGYAVIILTASNYEGLLETIRSRGVRYTFKKNSNLEVMEFLKKSNKLKNGMTDFVVSYSEGIIGRALELLESEDFNSIREETIGILSRLNDKKLGDVFKIYDFFEENKDSVDTIFGIMTSFYRDLLVASVSGNENILINSDKKDIILKYAARFSADKLMESIRILEDTHRMLKQNANYQLAIEVMLMKLQEEDIKW